MASPLPQSNRGYPFEWPTITLILLVYLCWAGLTIFGDQAPILAVLLLAPLITLHSSLQHESIHILEPRWPLLTRIIMAPAIGILVPYLRFRDTHLDHHINDLLTDPYDDPECQYVTPEDWQKLSIFSKILMQFNATLLGRILIGPAIGFIGFVFSDRRLATAGDTRVIKGWLWQIPSLLPVILWLVFVAEIPLWAYALAVYLSHSLLKIRTYLEHRAHEVANARSAIVEDRGVLAFLFLNNNFHATHHAHPTVPWYNLPTLYRAQRDKFLKANHSYFYKSYGAVFWSYLTRAKEPVPHPIWSLANRTTKPKS